MAGPPVELLARLLAGGVAGLAAAVAMDLPMSRQPDGWTPARIAVAVLRGRSLETVRFREASVLHHATGVLAGGLYGTVAFLVRTGLPAPLQAVPLLSHLLAVALVSLFIYLFFAGLVLPRAGGDVYEERATAVRGQWLRSTLTFAVALSVAGAPLLLVVRGALAA